MKTNYLTLTAPATEWLAAACYSQYLHDPLGRLPHYEELPERLKMKWRQIATNWLEAMFPLLNQGIKPHKPEIVNGFYLAPDNSDPPQLWVWRGERDESAEPWQRVQV